MCEGVMYRKSMAESMNVSELNLNTTDCVHDYVLFVM